MPEGRLITFEGVDGCGKSTQIRLAENWLIQRGMKVLTTFEPGGSPLGAEIRKVLLSGAHVPVAEAELLLFLADRAQHVREVIEPALRSGTWVLCDRYSDSTRAYQLAARKLDDQPGMEHELFERMLGFAECGIRPDLTLWFDVPVDEAMNRMRRRCAMGEVGTRLDEESGSFHLAVRDAFHRLWESEPSRIRRIDAAGSIDETLQQVCACLLHRFAELKA